MKIILVAGARPNFMKIAPLYNEFSKIKKINIFLVHTGQHYDYNMSETFWRDLKLPKPHLFLGVGSGSHATQTAKIMIEFEKVCFEIKPDLVVVVGDVNSTMACAITAKKVGISVAHVEAGLRSRDNTMPEEINRLITDAISDYLFTPSLDANKNLIREGVNQDKIHFVGNIMIDSLLAALSISSKLNTYTKFNVSSRNYGLITLHRPSNVDIPDKLLKILKVLNKLSSDIPLIFPVHPRTRTNIQKEDLFARLKISPQLKIIEPLGYLNFLDLTQHAKFVITDSGGIQEETTFLNIPCLTLRNNTERPITISEGTNELVALNDILRNVDLILKNQWKRGKIPKYWDGKAAARIVHILAKNA